MYSVWVASTALHAPAPGSCIASELSGTFVVIHQDRIHRGNHHHRRRHRCLFRTPQLCSQTCLVYYDNINIYILQLLSSQSILSHAHTRTHTHSPAHIFIYLYALVALALHMYPLPALFCLLPLLLVMFAASYAFGIFLFIALCFNRCCFYFSALAPNPSHSPCVLRCRILSIWFPFCMSCIISGLC